MEQECDELIIDNDILLTGTVTEIVREPKGRIILDVNDERIESLLPDMHEHSVQILAESAEISQVNYPNCRLSKVTRNSSKCKFPLEIMNSPTCNW